MSQALWCDRGGHPFSGNDDDRQHFTQSRIVKASGNPLENRTQVTVEVDICGPCFAANNPFEPAPKDSTRELETESKAYTEGYDAGVNHALRPSYTADQMADKNWNSGSGGPGGGSNA